MAAITPDMAQQGLRSLLAHRRLSKFADSAFIFLDEQGAEYLSEVVDVFDVLAKNLKLKPLEQNRFRQLLEDAVAVSPEALVEASTASPTQLHPAAQAAALAQEELAPVGAKSEYPALVKEELHQNEGEGSEVEGFEGEGSEGQDVLVQGEACGEYVLVQGEGSEDEDVLVQGEEVLVQVEGSEGEGSEDEGEAFVVVRLENSEAS